MRRLLQKPLNFEDLCRLFGLVSILTLASCSTIVGNVKPVDEKSDRYQIIDLSKEQPLVWRNLDAAQLLPKDAQIGNNSDAFSSEVTDFAVQSRKTAAIISLNSACRKGRGSLNDLKPYLNELFLGITDITERSEATPIVAGVPALEGVVAGKMAGEKTKIRAIVLSKSDCVYDLMYISRPDRFPTHEADFNRFVSSLRLR